MQTIQWTNHDSKQIHVASLVRVLVLLRLLIGSESGTWSFSQSQSIAKPKQSRNYFWHSIILSKWLCSCRRHDWCDPRFPFDTVREPESADRPSSNRTDSTTTATLLHSTTALTDTAAREHRRLARHQQVPEDSSAAGSGTCGLIQGFPAQYHWALHGAALSDYNRGK